MKDRKKKRNDDEADSQVQPNSNIEEPPVSVVHPELHHYTDWHGLEGILTSGNLWATHYRYLNDATEVGHLRQFLIDALTPRFETFFVEREPSLKKKTRDLIKQAGGILEAAKHDAEAWVDSFYRTTYGELADDTPFAIPYVVSFCSHARHHEYERENGLLSQWRGYGGEERYALIFQTAELEKQLEHEAAAYHYPFISLLDVIYNDGPSVLQTPPLTHLIDLLSDVFQKYLQDSDGLVDTFSPFVKTGTRFKHRGFREESEVRIVACPITSDRRRKLRQGFSDYRPPVEAIKQIYARGERSDIPYIRLFDSSRNRSLPISRIIVGPHRNQTFLTGKLRRFLAIVPWASDIPIVRSETPFR